MENVRAVERALELLECFSDSRKEIGLSELSRMLVLPKATVLRLARTLESKSYLVQDAANQSYRLGPKVLTLGNIFLSGFDYTDVALPFMQELRDKLEESVTLYVVSGESRMCVQRVASPHALRQVIDIGIRLPLHRGSAGKLLVAFQNLTSYIESIGKDEINRIRERGFAVSMEEREQGLASISVPVYNHKNNVIAALTVSGPSFRFTSEKVEVYLKDIKQTAKQISYHLGYIK